VQPDFAVAASYKWLLGPYSVGLLYVAPKWQGGIPLEENWIQRANARDFASLILYTEDYDSGARASTWASARTSRCCPPPCTP
jgi:selenocysteine lyase/cysteine desulfurase